MKIERHKFDIRHFQAKKVLQIVNNDQGVTNIEYTRHTYNIQQSFSI